MLTAIPVVTRVKSKLAYHLHHRRTLTREMAVRMVADIILINMALVAALLLRYLWAVSIEGSTASISTLLSYVWTYLRIGWLLTAISVTTFYAYGVYTYSRAYRRRYKIATIAKAVSISYAIFGVLLLLFHDLVVTWLSIILLSWMLTILFVGGARLTFMLWWRALDTERHYLPTPSRTEIRSVLVIGGAGYIGSALTAQLLDLGYHVRVLDCLLYGDEAIVPFYTHPNFELIEGDLRHIDTVVSAVKGMDAVVHLGAIVGDSACQVCEDLTIKINLEATRTIARVSKGYGVQRFVFASTCSVYGASDEILDEKSALNPLSLYARTKLVSEKVLLSLGDATFAPTILRFGTIYGLSGRARFDLVVNLLAAKAFQDGEAGIFGGAQWRPLVHVRDVAQAILLTLQAPLEDVRGQILNVGSNEQNYQIADLGLIIQNMVPHARVVTQPQEDNRNYRVRFDKIHDLLGFEPQYTVEDGVAEILSALASGQIADYRDPRYNNFAYLKSDGHIERVLTEDDDALTWPELAEPSLVAN
jgi:nucleoside-diphosphate-sugar epimerase